MKPIAIGLVLLILAGVTRAGVIIGKVTDLESGDPIPYATVRVEGTGRSMLANEEGGYRLKLDAGTYRLKFSHVAHYSEGSDVVVGEGETRQDAQLRLAYIPVADMKVYERDYDAAQRIIIEAIARKDEILSGLEKYDARAYSRFVVRNPDKPDSSAIMVITESQLEILWQHPDDYKEIITARKSSSNIESDQVILGVGQIPNFNENRIDFGFDPIISPVAKDALDHYRYYLLDTISYDGHPVFRLEIEPLNDYEPLFVGTVDIADSSYQVVGAAVGFSEAIDLPYFRDLKYDQRHSLFEDKYWMPVEVRFTAIADLPIPLVPTFDIDYVAAMYDYTFDVRHPDGTFDYTLVVDPGADDIDSVQWELGQIIPLTEMEIRGYERIDSVSNLPRPWYRWGLRGLFMGIGMATQYDIFHYNRVEGPYLGLGADLDNLIPRTGIEARGGYAFSRELWQYRFRAQHRLWDRHRLDIAAELHNQISRRPTIITREGANPTIMAFMNKSDPFDYFREKGLEVSAHIDPLRHFRFGVSYRDFRQFSEEVNEDYSVFRNDEESRVNPAIADGTLRSFGAELTWDSRRLMKVKGEEVPMYSSSIVRARLGVEVSSPELVNTDFDFLRYYLRVYHNRRLFGMGEMTVNLYAGASNKGLPPQRYFTLDFGDEMMTYDLYFKTLDEYNFSGSRALALYAEHQFGLRLWQRSRLPLVKDIPFSLTVYAGAFWTDFDDHEAFPGDELLRTAERPYREIGFSIGRITPLNLECYFTWQLSDYDTKDFTWMFGISF